MSNYENLAELLDTASTLLMKDGLSLDLDRLGRYVELIQKWNPVVGVVSPGDAQNVWRRHVVDSLSLAPVIRRFPLAGDTLLDIGSGAGFPAIPIKMVLPHLSIHLVERSAKKAGFLRKVVGALELEGVEIHACELSSVRFSMPPGFITARAVEKPERLAKQIPSLIGWNTLYLSQQGRSLGEGFVQERINDEWTTLGLRRGTLDIIRRLPG